MIEIHSSECSVPYCHEKVNVHFLNKKKKNVNLCWNHRTLVAQICWFETNLKGFTFEELLEALS